MAQLISPDDESAKFMENGLGYRRVRVSDGVPKATIIERFRIKLRSWLGIETIERWLGDESFNKMAARVSSLEVEHALAINALTEEISQLKHDLAEQSKQVEFLRSAIESNQARRQVLRPKTWREFQQLVGVIKAE